MLQFSQFVWPLSYSVWDVLNNFLLIDATDRRKISGDQKRFFIALSLYPLSFFANTPFKYQQSRLNVYYLVILKIQRRQTTFCEVHEICILWYTLCHLSSIVNRRWFSSRLLINMFIGTPCTVRSELKPSCAKAEVNVLWI